MYAVPRRHIASSVHVFDLGSEVPLGPGESWVQGKIHGSQHDEWGFPALAHRKKAGKKPDYFFFLSHVVVEFTD